MLKKMFMPLAIVANLFTLLAIVAVGFFNIQEVAAQEWLAHLPTEETVCLQQNIYFEARDQSTNGQVAVAWVTLNRVDDPRFPDTICGVVKQAKLDVNGNPIRNQCQFSWYCDGKPDVPGNTPAEQEAWEDARVIAEVVQLDRVRMQFQRDPTGGADHYHADYANPDAVYWTNAGIKTASIDNHVFYQVNW